MQPPWFWRVLRERVDLCKQWNERHGGAYQASLTALELGGFDADYRPGREQRFCLTATLGFDAVAPVATTSFIFFLSSFSKLHNVSWEVVPPIIRSDGCYTSVRVKFNGGVDLSIRHLDQFFREVTLASFSRSFNAIPNDVFSSLVDTLLHIGGFVGERAYDRYRDSISSE